MGKVNAKKPKGVGVQDKKSFKQSMRLEHAKFGQHLLRNPMIVEGMVDRAAIRTSDTVLEVKAVIKIATNYLITWLIRIRST